MKKCGYCGGNRLERVHRTFFERFSYLAVHKCWDCRAKEFRPHRYTYHLGKQVRCPKCGTYRVTRSNAPDKINSMMTGPLNFLKRWLGGKLYYCRFCRVQFFDRRKRASMTPLEEIAGENLRSAGC